MEIKENREDREDKEEYYMGTRMAIDIEQIAYSAGEAEQLTILISAQPLLCESAATQRQRVRL